MRNEKGFALILTLIVTALMVALAAELMHQVYVDTSISRNFRDGQQATILAESGIAAAKSMLQMVAPSRQYTSLSDMAMLATLVNRSDETGSITVTVVEEDGKINLNGLVQPNGSYEPNTLTVLKRLGTRIAHPVTDPKAWDNLAAWLDPNSPPVSGGVDTPYYQTLQPPYKARKGKLATIEELSMVKGFTPEIVADLRPYVTVYSQLSLASFAKININMAPKMVLAALSDQMTNGMIDRVVNEHQTDPNNPFKAVGELSKVPGLETIANELPGMIDVIGHTYRITAVGQVRDSARTVDAVVRISGMSGMPGMSGILSWREY